MAKLNRSQTELRARGMAESNTKVKAVTLAELDTTLSAYDARQNYAREICEEALATLERNDGTRYPDAFRYEFVNRATNIWYGLQKGRENRRREWKNALAGITTQAAREKIVALVKSMNVRGGNLQHDSLTVSRDGSSWGGPTLSWRFERDYDREPLRNVDDPGQAINFYNLEVKVSTGGTSYTPAELGLIIKIQTELLDIANEITVVMSRERVISTWGIPEEEPVVEQPAAQ